MTVTQALLGPWPRPFWDRDPGPFGTVTQALLGPWPRPFWDRNPGPFGTVTQALMEPSSLSYFDYRLSVIIRNFTTSSDYSISHHNVMDRFLKKRTATDSDPSSSSPHKKRKIPASAKQEDISWRMGSDRLYQEASSNNCLLISTRSSHCSQITESQYRFNHDLRKELHPS